MCRFRSLLLALCCWITCLPARGQANRFSIAPKPTWLAPYQPDLARRPDSKRIAEGYYQLLFEEQIQVEQKSTYRHIIRQIVSEAGIQNGSQVSVEYDPAYEQLIFHHVLIRRNGEVISKLAARNFKFLQQEEDLDAFIYSGTYTAHLILDDVRKGDQIEYDYTIVGRNPIFEHPYFHTFYLTSYEPIVNFYKCLIADSSRHFTFRGFNGARPLQRSLHGHDAWYEYKGDVPVLEDVDNAPSWYTNFPFVQVSEYSNWKQIVQWAQRINVVKSMGPLLRNKVYGLKAATGADRTAYMEKAIRFVQDDIRYMGIEMGENSHLPHTPDQVLAQRFGDCKDKSLLLCTILRANGIAADMAYANTDEGPILQTYLPTPDAFNHAIVHASLDGKSYWIDPTIAYQRGTLATLATPDYGQALIVNDSSTGLTAMHTRQAGEVTIREEFSIPDDNQQHASLRVISDYTHYFADDIRNEYASNSVKDEEDNFLSFYKKLYGRVSLKDSLVTVDSLRSNHFHSVELYTIQDPWKTDSTDHDKRVFYFRAKAFLDGLSPVDDAQRKAPVALRFPFRMHYTATFDRAEDFPEEAKEFEIKNAYYRVHFRPELENDEVVLHYDYETYTDHVPVAYLKQYIADLDRITGLCYLSSTQLDDRAAGNGNLEKAGNTLMVNYLALVISLLVLGIFSWLGWRYVHTYRDMQEYYGYAQNLGGWLLLLGLGLLMSLLAQLEHLFNLPVFNYMEVTKYTSNKGMQNGSVTETFMMLQLIVHLFFFVYTILLDLLFYFRRDVFPRTAIVYFAAYVGWGLLECLLVRNHPALGSIGNVYMMLAWNTVGALIWIPYLYFSRRSRETFLLPHVSQLEHGRRE
ncbi:hypothetical protein DCC81_02270 [Chitinophaga parva]|uniref:DUF3857 domain-containing protein n=1 Tax=Chitinophaga parva TaxID=2169414 RepID=A0A2T7BKZ6_9BACT|nr:hypothetical protein DCC81_02270 [Chitinophaga parva]